jgi:hypothetical protein
MAPAAAEIGLIPHRSAGRTARLLYWIAGIALLAFYLHLFVGRYIDDAYITLSYATTLARFGVWGMKPDLTSNAATSPLNVLLLAALIKVVRNPLAALFLFNGALGVAIYSSLRYFSLRLFGGELFGLLATALLLTNPLLTSTQGLESYLLIALVLLACRLWDREVWPMLGCVLGLLFLTRPDALAVSVVFVAMLCLRRQWRQALQVLGCFLLPVVPWLLFSWVHLSSLVPDTLFLKRTQASWNGYSFLQGPLLYWQKCPMAMLLSVILAPGVFLVRRRTLFARPSLASQPAGALLLGLGGYALLHFAAYSLLHVPPYHWYYAVEVTAITLFGALGLYAAGPRFRPWATAILLLVAALSAACSLRSVLVDGTPAIATNWATPSQYREIAVWINQNIPDRRLRMTTELGTVQFYTDADMVDIFADRSAIVAELARPHAPLTGALLRLNFMHFHAEDFSGIRYELEPCHGELTPLKQWATGTPYTGPRSWCIYHLATPVAAR